MKLAVTLLVLADLQGREVHNLHMSSSKQTNTLCMQVKAAAIF